MKTKNPPRCTICKTTSGVVYAMDTNWQGYLCKKPECVAAMRRYVAQKQKSTPLPR